MCLCASVRACEWIRSVLSEGAESRNVGRTAERTAKRSVTTMEKCSARHGSETNETMGDDSGGGRRAGRTRKVEDHVQK